jgi:predicted secreted hydrolase
VKRHPFRPRARRLRGASLALLALFVSAPPAAGADGGRFRPLDPKAAVTFPRDHGAHDDARVEWWYVTGHLVDAAGRRSGFQLTFFRTGIVDEAKGTRTSAFAPRDLHLAHFARTDVDGKTFRYAERTHRDGPGGASARTTHLDVANEDWRLTELGGKLVLRASDRVDGVEETLTLLLTPEKPPVLHGENGLSRKAPEPDAVSRYVSFTRLAAEGWLTRGNDARAVTGSAWMDHEWGSGAIGKGTTGWDWFSVQLDDGRDLMLYLLRGADGTATLHSSGTLVDRAGRAMPLAPADFSVEVTSRWTSPRSKGTYPARWTLRVPKAGLALEVVPLLADQELVTDRSTRVTYWEGACEVRPAPGASGPTGRAYVELTGYAGKGALGLF